MNDHARLEERPQRTGGKTFDEVLGAAFAAGYEAGLSMDNAQPLCPEHMDAAFDHWKRGQLP